MIDWWWIRTFLKNVLWKLFLNSLKRFNLSRLTNKARLLWRVQDRNIDETSTISFVKWMKNKPIYYLFILEKFCLSRREPSRIRGIHKSRRYERGGGDVPKVHINKMLIKWSTFEGVKNVNKTVHTSPTWFMDAHFSDLLSDKIRSNDKFRIYSTKVLLLLTCTFIDSRTILELEIYRILYNVNGHFKTFFLFPSPNLKTSSFYQFLSRPNLIFIF